MLSSDGCPFSTRTWTDHCPVVFCFGQTGAIVSKFCLLKGEEAVPQGGTVNNALSDAWRFRRTARSWRFRLKVPTAEGSTPTSGLRLSPIWDRAFGRTRNQWKPRPKTRNKLDVSPVPSI